MSVTINSAVFWADWPYPSDTTFEVRAESSKAWIADDLQIVPANESRVVGTGAITALRPTLPAITLPATSAGLDDQTSRWTVTLHRTGRKQVVSTVLADFPLPVSFEPSTTWAQVSINKNGKQPLRDTSVYTKIETNHQIDLAISALNISSLAGGRVIFANQLSGADVGAKINAANALLGADAGTIIYLGGGNIATQISLSPYRILHLGAGVYTCTTPDVPLLVDSFSIVEGEGWGTILEETTTLPLSQGGIQLGVIWQKPTYNSNGSTAQCIFIRDLQVRGARSDYGSAVPAIHLGNTHHFRVTNVYLNSTHAIGINAGAAPTIGLDPLALGRYAEDGVVSGCYFERVASQNLAVVNGKNIVFDSNIFKNPSQTGGPGVTVIDAEVNSWADDRMENITIINNVLDSRGSEITPHGNFIAYQPGTTYSGPAKISGNLAYADQHTSNGVFLTSNAKDLQISDNYFFGMGQAGIQAAGTRLWIMNNVLEDCGSGGVSSLLVDSVTNSVIADNIIRNPSAGTSNITESGASSNNNFSNNLVTTLSLNASPASGSVIFGIPQMAWVAPTLLNSWVNDSPTSTSGYQKINGIVYIRGMVKNGTGIPTVIFQLPVGFRPGKDISRATVSNGAFGHLFITASNGNVSVEVGSTTSVSLEMVFVAEA